MKSMEVVQETAAIIVHYVHLQHIVCPVSAAIEIYQTFVIVIYNFTNQSTKLVYHATVPVFHARVL